MIGDRLKTISTYCLKRLRGKTDGFTLMEMLVSLAMFTVVMTIAMASFLNVSDILRRAEAFRAVNDNFSFVVEAMTREIRTGNDYEYPNGGDFSSLRFKNSREETVTYRLQSGVIQRKQGGGGWNSFTGDDITIENLEFVVVGDNPSDNRRPMVTVLANGYTGEKEKNRIHFDLQTTVSQRKPTDG